MLMGYQPPFKLEEVRLGANYISLILEPEYGISQAFFCYTVAIFAVDRVLISRDI
jgi:hypothetical protein